MHASTSRPLVSSLARVGLTVAVLALSGIAVAADAPKSATVKPSDVGATTKMPRGLALPKTANPAKSARAKPDAKSATGPAERVVVLCRGGLLVWSPSSEGTRVLGTARVDGVGRWGESLAPGECGSPGTGWGKGKRGEVRMVRSDDTEYEQRAAMVTSCARDRDCVFAIEASWSADDRAWISKMWSGLSAVVRHPAIVSWPHGTSWPDAGLWW